MKSKVNMVLICLYYGFVVVKLLYYCGQSLEPAFPGFTSATCSLFPHQLTLHQGYYNHALRQVANLFNYM